MWGRCVRYRRGRSGSGEERAVVHKGGKGQKGEYREGAQPHAPREDYTAKDGDGDRHDTCVACANADDEDAHSVAWCGRQIPALKLFVSNKY